MLVTRLTKAIGCKVIFLLLDERLHVFLSKCGRLRLVSLLCVVTTIKFIVKTLEISALTCQQ